jgi:neutral ceramidase
LHLPGARAGDEGNHARLALTKRYALNLKNNIRLPQKNRGYLPEFVVSLKCMKTFRLLLSLTLLGLCIRHANAQNSTLYAGIAQLNITPAVGYPHYRDFGTAVNDSLYVKTVVFHQGNQKWAIAVCDLLWIERALSSEVRVAVAEQTGIPYEHIFLTATHTHTGPAYHSNIFELNNHNRKNTLSEEDAVGKGGYPTFLTNQIIQSFVEANQSAVPVTVKSASDTLRDVAFNRRFILKDGKVRTNPGRGNRDIVRAAGPVDPDLEMLLIEKKSDRSILGFITNFAVHSDTYGGTAFHPDYPGILANKLADRYGKNVVSLFWMGASGDLNHIDVRKNGVVLKTETIAQRLSEKIIKKQPAMLPVSSPALSASSEFVYAPLQTYLPEELNWAKDRSGGAKYGETGLFQLRRPMKIRSLERIRNTEAIPPTVESEPWILPVEVQVFRLSNDVAIVGLPGEIFSELALTIKRTSPFKKTIVVELTNSHIAYVPTRKAFAQGSYETLNSRLAPGGGELMVESAMRQLKALKK